MWNLSTKLRIFTPSLTRIPSASFAVRRQSGKATIQTNIEASDADPYMTNPGAVLFPTATNYAKVRATDHVEFWVGNAKQAAFYYMHCLGFQPLAYRGLETGSTDVTSYALVQNDIKLILSSPMAPGGPMNYFIDQHGDGMKHIALVVDDAEFAFNETVKRGAEPALEPRVTQDEHGEVAISGIKTYGDCVHLFIDRKKYQGPFLPKYKAWTPALKSQPVGLKYIDHMVGNVDWDEMDKWGDFYRNVFGMDQLISFDDKDVSTEFTALKSKVMTIDTGLVKYPINEPALGLKKSQIEEYIDFNRGPGVQHLALATNDIIATVGEMQKRGVEFLRVPDSYFDTLIDRVGDIKEDVAVLKQLGILVDRDDKGYLLQIFTKPMTDRPTFFVEVIQRRGGFSFGKGNFKALFVSIEEEQQKRGTL